MKVIKDHPCVAVFLIKYIIASISKVARGQIFSSIVNYSGLDKVSTFCQLFVNINFFLKRQSYKQNFSIEFSILKIFYFQFVHFIPKNTDEQTHNTSNTIQHNSTNTAAYTILEEQYYSEIPHRHISERGYIQI